MWNVVDSAIIERIWRAITSPVLKSKPNTATKLIKKIVDQGFAEIVDGKDLLWALDPRFADGDTKEISMSLGIPVRAIFPRPKVRDRACYGSMSMTAADVAALVINLERMGFDVDPSQIVDPLLGDLKKIEKLNDSELSVLWFYRERHKQSPLTLVADPKGIGQKTEEIRTPSNYRINLWRDSKAAATMLECYAPKFRQRHYHLFGRAA